MVQEEQQEKRKKIRRCGIEENGEESSLDIRFTVSLQVTNKPFPPDMNYRYGGKKYVRRSVQKR